MDAARPYTVSVGVATTIPALRCSAALRATASMFSLSALRSSVSNSSNLRVLEFFRPVRGRQRVDDLAQVAVHDGIDPVEGEVDVVVKDRTLPVTVRYAPSTSTSMKAT